MPYTKQIVCLANSYKYPNGRCIAGKEMPAGGWIRPVSPRPTHEVALDECRYADHTLPRLLDKIDVSLSESAPHFHQAENHVIQAGQQWLKIGTLPFEDLAALCDDPPALWVNSQSTALGHNDCISQEEAAEFTHSLLLLRPEDFSVEIGTNPWQGRRTYRGDFRYKGIHYSLSLTDPRAREVYGNAPGDHPLNDVYICVSLTEPFEQDGRCHKLVASVIKNPLL
ncbi:MAG TPA: hypothetical protein VH583_17760 [Vicinamibacterales bacterium]|jgi:hypothetical protein